MATTADREVNRVPKKMRKFQRLRLQTGANLEDAKGLRKSVLEKLNRAQGNLRALERVPNPYIEGEKTELERGIEAAKASVASLKALLDDAQSEVAEISADHRSICRTTRALEQHLGLGEGDQLTEHHRVLGEDGDNFQVNDPGDGEDFYSGERS